MLGSAGEFRVLAAPADKLLFHLPRCGPGLVRHAGNASTFWQDTRRGMIARAGEQGAST